MKQPTVWSWFFFSLPHALPPPFHANAPTGSCDLRPCSTAAGVLIDRNPFSENLLAMPHGRVAMAHCAVKIALCLAFAVQSTVNVVVVLTTVCIAAAVVLYSSVYYLPYTHNVMNQAQCGFAAMFAWSSGCLVMAYLRSASTTGAEAFLLLFAMPAIVFSGYSVARQRLLAMRSADMEVTAASSACIVELRSRVLLQTLRGDGASHHHYNGDGSESLRFGEDGGEVKPFLANAEVRNP